MSREIPILFQTSMVIAINKDRKTNTRRLTGLDEVNLAPDEWRLATIDDVYLDGRLQGYGALFQGIENPKAVEFVKCPYGKPGDRLWVRETWCPTENPEGDVFGKYLFKSMGDEPHGRWRPSIHMPKAAARIWLEVEEVRVERLQDMSEEDAWNEGIESDPTGASEGANGEVIWNFKNYAKTGYRYIPAIDSFRSLWQLINGPSSWEQNPWVWVVKFQRIEK